MIPCLNNLKCILGIFFPSSAFAKNEIQPPCPALKKDCQKNPIISIGEFNIFEFLKTLSHAHIIYDV